MVDGGGDNRVSASLLLLLLSKTVAAASSHVGMCDLVFEGIGRFGSVFSGDVGAFVGVAGDGGGVGVSTSLFFSSASKVALHTYFINFLGIY